MKVAIVHEWLVNYGGSERVLEQMLLCYPDADVFSLIDFVPPDERFFLQGKTVKTSFIQHLPGAAQHYRKYLPLMPLAVEQLDVSAYDLVISSSHAVAKGVLVSPDQLHLCMCYTPIRYAWDLQHQYLQESGLGAGMKAWLVRWMLHKIRMWDVRTSNGVDHFIAISHYISRRIAKSYRREAEVIYPPVDTEYFVPLSANDSKDGFYLTASRMVPYKKMALIIEAFSRMPDKILIVIGEGPDMAKCQAAAGPNVKILGRKSGAILKLHLQQAKAFVFAAEEDFGITPIEAQACGTPVIAFNKGGAVETVRGLSSRAPTGVFYDEQTEEAIIRAVHEFESQSHRISAQACRDNALRFSAARFRQEFKDCVQKHAEAFEQKQQIGTSEPQPMRLVDARVAPRSI
jgi:glycosyltransferase involved in cell wall biosynthesis